MLIHNGNIDNIMDIKCFIIIHIVNINDAVNVHHFELLYMMEILIMLSM